MPAMKMEVAMRILFRLLRRRKCSAAELAAEFDISERSIHRYVQELSIAGVPLVIIRGRKGGICLPDTFRLPENFFTRKEYEAAVNALTALYEQLRDPAAESALEKLRRQEKADGRGMTISGNILVDSSSWGDAYIFPQLLRVAEEAIEGCQCLHIHYTDREGKESRRVVEPHLLIYKQNVWYLYAWCRSKNGFRLFRIGRIRSAYTDGETFERREVRREALPLQFHFADAEMTQLRLEVTPAALPDVEEWLGMSAIRHGPNGALLAEATLPAGEVLLSRLLSLGGGVRVLEPASLAEALRARAEQIAALYGGKQPLR